VDAESGEVLRCASRVHEAEPRDPPAARFHGSVRARIHAPTPFGEERVAPLPHLALAALDGETPLGAGESDPDGAFDLGSAPAFEPRVRAVLEGRYASVRRGSLPASPPSAAWAQPDGPLDALWDSTHARAAELEAYVHLSAARERLRARGIDLPGLDRPVPLVVGDSSLVCNALTYATPDAPWIRFSADNSGCTEMARIADVVYHEYAHLIALFAYDPEDVPDSLREGFTDFFAASLVDSSRVGRDWRGPGTWLRDLRHDRTYPVSPSCGGAPHCVGAIVAGALWDLRASLIADLPDRETAVALAERLFLRMLLARPHNVQTCILYLLLQDDDDGDLGNGTPHLEAIARAFERHGLGDFTVRLSHEPLRDTEEQGPRAVEVTVSSIDPPDPAGVRLHYRVDDGPERALTLQGEGWVFRGELPAAPAGARVRYHFSAADRAGHAATLPAGAPSAAFAYHIGSDATPPGVGHLPVAAVPEGAAGFWVAARLSDERGGLPSGYVDVSRLGDGDTLALAPKAPGDPTFGDIAEAFVALGPLRAGDRVEYRIRAYDPPPASNRRDFPGDGAISVAVRRGRGWDLEAGPADLGLDGAWARDAFPLATLAGSTSVPSGRHAASLRPAVGRALPAGAAQTLRLPVVDLRGWSRARLECLAWFDMPGRHAGGRLEASIDDGMTWTALEPLGGYPGRMWVDLDEDGSYDPAVPAWNGASNGWRPAVYSLDAVCGWPVRLRFAGWTEGLAPGQGWWIDDLRLLDAPARPAPEGLTASSGEDRRVRLIWAPLAGEGPASGFLGYRVYRGLASGDYGPDPLDLEPGTATSRDDRVVSNGTRYFYTVRGCWDDGEGPAADEAVGHPYRASGAAAAEIETVLDPDGTARDTLRLANAGTGPLTFSFYVADEGDAWEDRRVECALPNPSFGFTRLCRDAREGQAVDLRSLSYRTVGGNLLLRVGLHAPLPDPRIEGTVRIFLDCDLCPGTGIPEVNLGAEYVVVLGRWVHEQTEGDALGYLLDDRLRYVARPSFLSLWAGLDSLEVGIPLDAIGYPARLACAVRADADLMPDAPSPGWLAVRPRSGSALPEASLPVELAYDLRGAPGLEHRAQLLVATNDPDRPRWSIPVTVLRGPPGESGGPRLERAYPVPSGSEVALRLLVPAGEAWSVDILDVTGRRVRRLAEGAAGPAGLRLLRWDGRRQDATRIESGVYYVLARAGGARASLPVLIVR
jgi:hypothetical protein